MGEFVEFLGAARAADGELVGSEGGGDGGSDLFGDCGGDNSAEMVPQAIGRMWPLGLRSGMTRAEASASRVVGWTRAVAR